MTWNQHADWLLKRTRRWPRILLSWSMAKSKLYYVIWPRLDGRVLTSSFLTVWSLNTILKLHSFWPRLQTVFASCVVNPSCKQLIVPLDQIWTFVKTKQVVSNIQWRKHNDPIKIPPKCCYIYISYEKQKIKNNNHQDQYAWVVLYNRKFQRRQNFICESQKQQYAFLFYFD